MMIWLIIGNGISRHKASGHYRPANKIDAISRSWRMISDAFSGYEELPYSFKELLLLAASSI
jgi:hypothetical protein